MAQANLAVTKLRLTFEAGMNEKGEPVYKAKTFNNIKTSATTDQLFQTANAIAALCIDPLYSVERNDSLDIVG